MSKSWGRLHQIFVAFSEKLILKISKIDLTIFPLYVLQNYISKMIDLVNLLFQIVGKLYNIKIDSNLRAST